MPVRAAALPESGVPPAALRALDAGRYWRASRILRKYLATARDSAPTAVLLAARADAGWGAWSRVVNLLDGQDWLDQTDGGRGWLLLGHSRFEEGDWQKSAYAYARFLQVAPATGRQPGIAQVQRGRALSRAGQAPQALAAYDSAARLLPALKGWISLYAARTAASTGDTAEVKRRLAASGATLRRQFGWIVRIRALEQAGDSAAALHTAAVTTRSRSDRGVRARAYNIAAALRLARGDTAIAVNDYRLAMKAAPLGTSGVAAARALSQLPHLSPQDRLDVGRLYMRNGNASRGVDGFKAYISSRHGTPAQRRHIRYELAQAYFAEGDYGAAEKELRSLIPHEPKHTAADMLYLVGRAQYRAGHTTRALTTFRRTAARYPGSDAATQALFLIADLSHDKGDTARARTYYHRTIASNANANKAGIAMMRLADMAIVQGDTAHAEAIFDQYRRRHPDGRRVQEATFWAARMRELRGRSRSARTLYRRAWTLDPFSYYGMQAADRLGLSLTDAPLKTSPRTPASTRTRVAHALARLDLLRQIGDDSAASFEVSRVRRSFRHPDAAVYDVAEALEHRGYTVDGINLGWELHRREGGWNRRLLRIVYPFPYQSLVVAEAREHDLDPFLMAGLIRQESMFKADIVSSAGAIGLMQVLPHTGRLLARAEDVRPFNADMLKEPEINLHLGAMYLKQLIDDYNGRLPAVLAAYNAGPTRVARWKAFPEWHRPELFTERIPYAETRDYVRIVQGNADLYRMLYRHDVSGSHVGDDPAPGRLR